MIKTCANCANCGNCDFSMAALQELPENIQVPDRKRSFFQNGNHKMIVTSEISNYAFYSFSLPCKVTCPGKGMDLNGCNNWCFGGVGRCAAPSVVLGQYRNLKQLVTDPEFFVESAIRQLKKLLAKETKNGRLGLYVRIDDTGDFPNTEIFMIWYRIMRACPEVRFYFYTKSWHLMPSDPLPSNCCYLQSMGSSHDSDADPTKPRVLIRPFGSPCPEGQIEGGTSDWLAANATGNVIFSIEAHGALKRRVKAKKIHA